VKLPNIPTDREIFESAIAHYWFEDGILISRSKSVLRTVENISANADLIRQISNGKPVPLLTYLSKSPMPDKQTRQLSAEIVPQIYRAMAMVSEPGLSAFIIKVVFAFQRPPIPMKNFSNAADARNWLLTHK
jgi:hypothetical protein